jgi:pimeloyl-ACP methyl ester carboxylesterase
MVTPISGTAAGVPYTALAPAEETGSIIVTWHMMDAPRTPAAFAAALPLDDVPAWRLHLGMPYSGPRMVNGTMDAGMELVRADPMMSYVAAFVDQAAAEFPTALAEARTQLGIADGPVALLGGSLGGAVVLRNLALEQVPVQAAALVNPGIRARSVVGLVEGLLGTPYPWSPPSNAAADRLDFVAQAHTLPDIPILIISGDQDHPTLRTDATDLITALKDRGTEATLVTIPNLAHPLADEPGLDPAPQWPTTKQVDATLSAWFHHNFPQQ